MIARTMWPELHDLPAAGGAAPPRDAPAQPCAPPHWRDACVAALDAIAAQPSHPKIGRMLAYYRSIVPADRLPGRACFDPVDVPALLPNVWLLEYEPGPRFRYRLMGTRVAAAFQGDLTGRYLGEAHHPRAAAAMRDYLIGVMETRCPHFRRGSPTAWPIAEFLTLERLYLPLAADGATVDMILGFTVFLKRDGSEF
jgi:hypothetical protein